MVASLSKSKQNSSRTIRSVAPRAGRLDFPKPPALFALPVVKMTFLRSLPYPLLIVIAFGLTVLTGCGEDDPRLAYGETQYLGAVYGDAPVASTAPVDNVSYWDGEGVTGKPSIKIRLGEQRAYFYKGGKLVGISQLSTGREGLDTPVGQYKITQKDIDHASSRYGDYVDANDNVVVPNIDNEKDHKPPGTKYKGAPMPYFMRIVGGVGMHAGYLPGYPASHGCIRMPEFMAEDFFNNVEAGTPVTIEP
jgi:lipoprotein-anchoring transpeptidase ErfK/SrfK